MVFILLLNFCLVDKRKGSIEELSLIVT